MTFFRREADRLDAYLDDQVAGRAVDPDADDLDPASDRNLDLGDDGYGAHAVRSRSEIRYLENHHALARNRRRPSRQPPQTPPARRHDELAKPRWSHRAMAFVGTAALTAGLAVGIVGYDRFSGGGAPNEPTSIPAASFFLPGTPEATGCDVPRREPGAIEQIMETPPSQTPYFPRLNGNPFPHPILSWEPRAMETPSMAQACG